MARTFKDKLPRSFDRILESGEEQAFREVYESRTLDARDRHGDTALHRPEVPEAHQVWLLEQGLDPDVRNAAGDTPLHVLTRATDRDPGFLLAHGADAGAVNNEGESVAFGAVFRPAQLRALIAAGADPGARANDGTSPLMRLVRAGDTNRPAQLVESLRLLAEAELTATELREAQERIIELGQLLGEVRASGDPARIARAEEDMRFLYERFAIPAELRADAPARHDGHSPITLSGGSWSERFLDGHDILVPAVGRAGTLQGEVIRIAGLVSTQFHGDQGADRDKGHKRMLRYLVAATTRGTPLPEEQQLELEAAAKAVRRGEPTEEQVDALPRLATAWVVANPEPLPVAESEHER